MGANRSRPIIAVGTREVMVPSLFVSSYDTIIFWTGKDVCGLGRV